MNSKWQKTINILTLALLVICLIKIGWLQGDIRNLQNTVNNNRSMLQSSIDSISSRIRYEMEQENNLLSDSRWNTIGLDVKNRTATLYCYVVPKVYNPEKTVATISSVTEMLSNGKKPEDIVEQLLSDYEIEYFENQETAYKCDCSRERTDRALISIGKEELTKLIEEDGKAEITCHFCDNVYNYTKEELEALLESAK